MKINRREILKLSAGTLMAALVSPLISAQSAKGPSSAGAELSATKVDGNISYNAGWVVPLDDKAGLLELEAKKTKERDDLVKQKAGATSSVAPGAKEESKSFSKRVQDIFEKLTKLF